MEQQTTDIQLFLQRDMLEFLEEEKKVLDMKEETAREEAMKEPTLVLKDSLDVKIGEVEKIIFINIRKKNLKEAMLDYKQLKKYFEEYPAKYKSEKQEIYSNLLSYYLQIQKLKKELQQEQDKGYSQEGAAPESKQKKLRLEEIKQAIFEIKRDVKNQRFDSAVNRVLELKHQASQIPDDYKSLRGILETKTDLMLQRISFIRRMREHNEKKEVETS